MKTYFCFFLIICSLSIKTTAQKIGIKVVKYTDSNPFNSSRFPLLIGGNINITEKINSYISKSELDLDYKKARKNIFEVLKRNESVMLGKHLGIDYEIHILNDKFYSVMISGEACGAYCEEYKTHYNFDLTTGKKIDLIKLIKPNMVSNLVDTLDQIKKSMIKEARETADSILKHQKLDSLDREYYTDMLELYTYCAKSDLESLDYCEFYLTPMELVITSDRCSAHYNRNVDEIGRFEFRLDYIKWNRFFSDYGKRVINACVTLKHL